jgi:hypothetical protein
MMSIRFFPFRSDWVRIIAFCVAVLTSADAYADFANCDGDMTDDQRFQAELCSAHVGCRLVFEIGATCAKVKSFLSKLGLGHKGSATRLTDDQVSSALDQTGIPPSGISSCTIKFNRDKCKEYMSGEPKQPSAKEQADEIVERLNSKVYSTTVWDAGLGLTKEWLLMCDNATNEANGRDAGRAKERCTRAEKSIQECLSTKTSHEELRQKLQGLIANGGLGANAAQYRSVANTRYPECPNTLPSSGKTPKVALIDYLKLWDTPEESRSKQADTTDGAGATALRRGGANSGAGLIEKALTQIDQEDKDRLTQEAHAREDEARRIRIEQENAAAAPSATAKTQPASGSSVNSGTVDPNAWSKRVCDGQCSMIVAEEKCKHVAGNLENLKCKGQYGMIQDDTPALCAEAKALSGCVTKAEKEASQKMRTTAASGSSYKTVCHRNEEKIMNSLNAMDAKHYPGTGSFDIDVSKARADLYRPCINDDSEAAYIYNRWMELANKRIKYCAEPQKCTQWGSPDYVAAANQAYYQRLKAEVDKALSNPNYSAELGPISANGGRSGDPAEAACDVGLKEISRQFNAVDKTIPKDSVVVRSEATMWMLASGIEKIKADCPQSKRYRTEMDKYEKTYKEVQRVCDASAVVSPYCKPRLPGKADYANQNSPPVREGKQQKCILAKDLDDDCSGMQNNAGAKRSEDCPNGGNLVNGQCRQGVAQ